MIAELAHNTAAEVFFDAIEPNETFDFIVDTRQVSSDLAACLSIRCEERRLHGSFVSLRNQLFDANSLGANIQISLSDQNVVWVRRPAYEVTAEKPAIPPHFCIQESSQWETWYWQTDQLGSNQRKDLLVQLANQYGGDLGACDPNVRHHVPGFDRHHDRYMHEHSFAVSPRDLAPWLTGSMSERTSAKALAASLIPTPRRSPAERMTEIEESLEEAVKVFYKCDGYLADHLIDICNHCVKRGVPIADIVNLCLSINRMQNWPRDEDDILLMCHSRLDAFSRENETTSYHSTSERLFSIKSARVDYFLNTSPPKQRWLLENCLPEGKAGLIVARGGTGKSQFALQLAISIATGLSFIPDWPVGARGKVLALFAEDEDEEIHRRFWPAANASAQAFHEPLEFFSRLRENLFIKSMVGKNNLMTSADYSKEVSETDFLNRLLDTIAGLGQFKLIIIDPASRFRGGDENKAQDTTRFVEVIERLVKATGATAIVIHHVNKASGNNSEAIQEASRGSSALTDGVRWQMNLATMSPAEGKEYGVSEDDRRLHVVAQVTKNNYAPPQGKIILKRGDGGYLRHITLTSQKTLQQQDVKSKIVQLVEDEAKASRRYSKTAFEGTFGGMAGPLGIGKNAVRDALTELLKVNRLSMKEGKLAPRHKIKIEIPMT